MSDWANTVADIEAGTASFAITPSATAHVKGAWAGYVPVASVIGAGLAINLSWWQNYTTARTIMFDIGIGESGSQSILVPNLVFQPSSVGITACRAHQNELYLPIAVPKEKLWVRAQASMASHAVGYLYPHVIGGGTPPAGSVCTAYGVNTATTLGVVVTASNTENVSGSWAEITPSCSRIRSLLIAINGGGNSLTTYQDQWHNLDIGIGPASSEVVLLSPGESGGACSSTGLVFPQFLGPYSVDIPAGTRIAARLRTQYSSSLQRTRYVSLYGIS